MPKAKKSEAMQFLDDLIEEPMTLGSNLRAIREGEEMSLAEFAAQLEVSRQHLHAVEQGRAAVSVERAVAWARALGYSEKQFVRLALQDQVSRAGLEYKVAL